MIRINLLPYWEKKKKAGVTRQIIILSAAVFLFFLAVLSVHFYMHMEITSLEEKVRHAEDHLAKLTKITGDVDRVAKDKEIIKKKLEIIKNLEKNRMDPVHLMDEIARGLPTGRVWIVSLNQSGPTLQLKGLAMSNTAIADFMINLEKSDFITTVDLVSSKQEVVSNIKLMDFVLSCRLIRG